MIGNETYPEYLYGKFGSEDMLSFCVWQYLTFYFYSPGPKLLYKNHGNKLT